MPVTLIKRPLDTDRPLIWQELPVIPGSWQGHSFDFSPR